MRRDALCAALLRTIAANGTMSIAEFDLLRFVSVSLGVVAPATGLLRLEDSEPSSAARLARV